MSSTFHCSPVELSSLFISFFSAFSPEDKRENSLVVAKETLKGDINPRDKILFFPRWKLYPANIFQSIEFLEHLYCSQIMSYLRRKCKSLGVTNFVSEIKRVENYPDFLKISARNSGTQHGLRGFIMRNIEDGSVEENDHNHVL